MSRLSVNVFAELLNNDMRMDETEPDLCPVFGGKVVDTRTGKVSERLRQHMFSKQFPVNFSHVLPEHKRVEAFMLPIVKHDMELLRYIQTVFGYAMTGRTSEQKMWILHGEVDNGKTSFMNAVGSVMGEFARRGDWRTLTTREPDMLVEMTGGSRIFNFPVFPMYSHMDARQIKAIATATDLDNQVPAKTRISCKVFVQANDLPRVDAETIGNRVNVIPFLARFTEKPEPGEYKVDKDLLKVGEDQAFADELFSWLLIGAMRWHKEGLGELPEAVVSAHETYVQDQDYLQLFIDYHCQVSPGVSCPARLLKLQFLRWCDDEDCSDKHAGKFDDMMETKGFRQCALARGGKEWVGIRFIG